MNILCPIDRRAGYDSEGNGVPVLDRGLKATQADRSVYYYKRIAIEVKQMKKFFGVILLGWGSVSLLGMIVAIVQGNAEPFDQLFKSAMHPKIAIDYSEVLLGRIAEGGIQVIIIWALIYYGWKMLRDRPVILPLVSRGEK